jgi:hypothetical protein
MHPPVGNVKILLSATILLPKAMRISEKNMAKKGTN